MKKILFAVMCSFSMTIFAQAKLNEGVIVSKQTMSSDNEQVNAQLAMLGDMTTTTYFKNNKSRSETKNPMTGNTVFIADDNTKKSLLLMDNAMMGKTYSEADMLPSEEDLKGMTIEKTDEKKTILGYECVKYNVNLKKDNADMKMVMYTTDKLQAISQQTSSFGKELDGYPLYMSLAVVQNGMNMDLVIEVTEVKAEKVSDDKFDMTPPEGYKKTDLPMGM